jgi:hypothetical protein
VTKRRGTRALAQACDGTRRKLYDAFSWACPPGPSVKPAELLFNRGARVVESMYLRLCIGLHCKLGNLGSPVDACSTAFGSGLQANKISLHWSCPKLALKMAPSKS